MARALAQGIAHLQRAAIGVIPVRRRAIRLDRHASDWSNLMTPVQRIEYEPAPQLPPARASGEAPVFIDLPRPRHDAGAPLLSALARRRSTRDYADTPIALDTLGELLWAANGINRPETDGHTAPSAQAFNEIDIYVALPHGVYRYEPEFDRLALKHAVDARNMTGYQDFVGKAPLDLVYVLRGSRCSRRRASSANCSRASPPARFARTSRSTAPPRGSPPWCAAGSTTGCLPMCCG